MTVTALLGACRWCGRDVYAGSGALVEHPCCAREAEIDPNAPCGSCQASADHARRRGEQRPRDIRE